MNEKMRRLLMMIGIITIGTILVLFNASFIITISASIVFGFVMTIGLGLLKTEDIKKIIATKNSKTESSKKNPEDERSKQNKGNKNKFSGKLFSGFQKKNKNNDLKKEPKKAKESKKPKESKNTRISAGLAAAIGSFNTTITKKHDKKHAEKIDSLLNTAIDEPIQSPTDTEISQSDLPLMNNNDGLSDGIDSFDDEDFGNLDSLEIEGEEMPTNFDLDIPVESSSHLNQGSDELNLDNEINSILLAAGETPDETDGELVLQGIEDGLDEESFVDIPDSVPDLQSGSPNDSLNDSLNELDNITGFEETNLDNDDFSNLETINLDELETDDLLIETEEIIIEDEEIIDDVDLIPDENTPLEDQNISEKDGMNLGNETSLFGNSSFGTPEIEEKVSFSKTGEFDDILSVLESDIKKTKKGPEPSLLRDLKDIHVESNDLVEELETVLNSMGMKKSQNKFQNNGGEE